MTMSKTHYCVLALLLGACGGSANGNEPTPTGDADSRADAVPADAAPEASPDAAVDSAPLDTCAAAADLPDDLGADTNCDGVDGVVGVDVYVDAVNGSDTNVGTPAKPRHGLGSALALAASRNGHVLLSAGTFEVNTVSQPGKWSIVGGYDTKFQGAPKRELTILKAPSTGLLVDAATDATLSHLTVSGANASDVTARTAHGLRSRAMRLTLDDVVVTAGDGLAGASGLAGTAGTAGAAGPTSSGYTTVACAGISPTLSVQVTNPGALSGDGMLPGSVPDLRPAAAGGDGATGTDGQDASSAPNLSSELVVWPSGANGRSDGRPGYAGAGGGYKFDGPTPGGGGSGGCPGLGGTGGSGGGGSVAVLVLSGDATISRSLLKTGTAGRGGDGAAGGPGGGGGAGGIPTAGGIASWPAVCIPRVFVNASNDPAKVNCAYYGAAGGAGGKGGHGGGGTGGWTLAVVTAGTATSNVDAATTSDLGRPGDGGAGNGGGYAPMGEKHATYKLP